MALPYGYSVTLWASGAIVVARHGVPRAEQVWMFALGAPLGFAVVALLRHLGPRMRMVGSPTAGLLQIASVAGALATATLAARLAGSWSWLLASFLATAVFLALSTLAVMLSGWLDRLAGSASKEPDRR